MLLFSLSVFNVYIVWIGWTIKSSGDIIHWRNRVALVNVRPSSLRFILTTDVFSQDLLGFLHGGHEAVHWRLWGSGSYLHALVLRWSMWKLQIETGGRWSNWIQPSDILLSPRCSALSPSGRCALTPSWWRSGRQDRWRGSDSHTDQAAAVLCNVWIQSAHLLDVLVELAIREDLAWGRLTHLMSDGVQQLLIQRLQLQEEINRVRVRGENNHNFSLCEVQHANGDTSSSLCLLAFSSGSSSSLKS